MKRDDMTAAISDDQTIWDVVVIGGGATGLGTALDAVSRGYRTVLIEAADFAKGTSSRSTKLIHGGVRYLRQGQIRMVRQSLVERGRLQRNAPHVVHPMRFVIPSYQVAARWYYFAGMRVYDLLSGRLGYEGSQLLSRRQTSDVLPTLETRGLRGGVLYSDGQFDDARLAIALARTIADSGGTVINYVGAVGFGYQHGKLSSVIARDQETGLEHELRARSVVNATGVFGQQVMQLDRPDAQPPETRSEQAPKIIPSQGTHLVLDQRFLGSDYGLMIPDTSDGRVLFAIPWHGRLLLGTTDNQVQDVQLEPKPMDEEIDYLLEHAGRYLTKAPGRADVLSMFAGLRPLVGKGAAGQRTSQLSREHEIYTSPSGLVSVIGGKWTTYRQMGQDVVDLAAKVGGLEPRPSRTASLPLRGCGHRDQTHRESAGEDPLAVYGTDATEIRRLAEDAPESARRLHSDLPYLTAQVTWAAEYEMARTTEDALARRTRALLLDAEAAGQCAETATCLLQRLLGKDDAWKENQILQFRELAGQYRCR